MDQAFGREELLRYISIYGRVRALGGDPKIDLLHRSGARIKRLGVLQGSFDPLTVAHDALIEGALGRGLDAVLILVSSAHYHKGVSLGENSAIADRALALEEYAQGRGRTDLGLSNIRRFVDLIDPIKGLYGPGVDLSFIFGLDVFEMVLDRKYYDHYEESLRKLFREEVLVAGRSRKGVENLQLPAWMEGRVEELSVPQPRSLEMPVGEVSSTLVRTLRRRGEDCTLYVPDGIHHWMEKRRLYQDPVKYPMAVQAIETFADRHPGEDPGEYLGDLEAVLGIVYGAGDGSIGVAAGRIARRYAVGELDARGAFLAFMDLGLSPGVAYGAVTGIIHEALVEDGSYDRLQRAGLKIALSCVDGGGDMASILQRRAGSSAYLSAGLVPYSPEAKGIVGVDPRAGYGAVSMECARAMAHGLKERTGCDVALAETGIMPTLGGRRTRKPHGLVCMHLLSGRSDEGKEHRLESTPGLDLDARRMEVLIQVVEIGIKRVLKEVELLRPSPWPSPPRRP